MFNFLKNLFAKSDVDDYYTKRIAVHVPKDMSDYMAGRGKLITVKVPENAYLAYIFNEKGKTFGGIAVDCRGCRVFKRGDVVKFELRGIGMPVAIVE